MIPVSGGTTLALARRAPCIEYSRCYKLCSSFFCSDQGQNIFRAFMLLTDATRSSDEIYDDLRLSLKTGFSALMTLALSAST
mmetsp:Transcript_18731/g.36767  ORF Transcript_18731/g.36767 Transcript_18731/m.36767 type:complete len:82 (+) Transcript_18731:300-545(+)